MNGYIERELNREDCYTKSSRKVESDLLDWNFDLAITHQKSLEKIRHYTESATTSWVMLYQSVILKSDLEIKFNDLSQKWQDETGLFSINKQKVNDTFLEIISLGKDIIPFILNELKSPYSTASWHIALKALAHVNPVLDIELRDSDIVKSKWIEWGKINGLI